MSIWTKIFGGWKTWGPNQIVGDGALASSDTTGLYDAVTSNNAIKLGALWACAHLRAETVGSLPLHLRDEKKIIMKDHDLYNVLNRSPNSLQTAPEFWSQQTAITDMHGNSLSEIKRRSRDGSVISLEPFGQEASEQFQIMQDKGGQPYYTICGEKYDVDQVLHLKGFGMDGLTGIGRLAAGRHILQAQIGANDAALRGFKQGLKIGGFLKNTGTQNWTTDQIKEIKKRLDDYAKPENSGKWMTLLMGMEPIAGEKFTINPIDAQLLESRYFGVEEICRLYNVPPQLIGHSDKASSWASSLEQVNLFFLMYSLMPDLIRKEARIVKSLIPRKEWGKVEAKFSIQGLLRADTKTRFQAYASALQNGYYNRDEVRDLEERASIPGGDKYTVQLNMTDVSKTPGDDKGDEK